MFPEWFCLDNKYYVKGKLNEKLEPTPFELFSAHIVPPCASIIPFEIKILVLCRDSM